MNKLNASGFTLIELMVTVAVIAIVLTIGVPSFQGVIMNNRMATQANDLLGSMNLSRSEAVKRGRRVALCKTAAPFAATPACTTSGAWGQGWLIFVDSDNDATLDPGEVLLKVHQGISPSTLTALSTTPNVANYLSYAADGTTRLTDNTFQSGTLMLCPGTSGMTGRRIVVNAAGRAWIASVTC